MIIEEPEIQDIIDEYKSELPDRFQHISRCLKEFEITSSHVPLTDAISQAHRLRGTGTLFGLPWVSDIAAHVEDNLKAIYKQLFRRGSQ